MNRISFCRTGYLHPLWWCAAAAACAALFFPGLAYANLSNLPPGTCTTDIQFNIPVPAAGKGIVSLVIYNIAVVLQTVSGAMFGAIITNPSFAVALKASMTIYVAIYGILFLFAMVQITLFDFVMRMIKLAIVAFLLSPGSWAWFNGTVVTFFNTGTDALIAVMSTIAIGSVPGLDPNQPFAVLDAGITKVTSAKMAVNMMALAFTGPYGVFFVILVVMSIGTFVGALFEAVWVYVMSLVVKALLFGLAPIFLCFLLFSRTRHLFDGWLNQLVNASLQPIMLFAFFAFFAKLIEASVDRILRFPVCFVRADAVAGSTEDVYYWRYAIWNWSSGQYELYMGRWGLAGAHCPAGTPPGQCPIFPVDIMDILIFLLLAQLAWRFNSVVLSLAKDLAGASTSMAMSGNLGEWFSPIGGKKESLAPHAGGAPAVNLQRQIQAAERALAEAKSPQARKAAAARLAALRGGAGGLAGQLQDKGFVGAITDQLSQMQNRRT